MAFYKLESTYPAIKSDNHKQSYRPKRTYRYYHTDELRMSLRLKHELNNKATVKIKEISESEYIKGTRPD